MCICTNNPALFPSNLNALFNAPLALYHQFYDESFDEISDRIAKTGSAGKLDIIALAAWKRSAQGHWLDPLLRTPEITVRKVTAGAFAPNLTDACRVLALAQLDGFKAGKFAIGSAVLTAWNRAEFGVTDIHARRAIRDLFNNCNCKLSDYAGSYLPALRALRDALNMSNSIAVTAWTARTVDMALVMMDMTTTTPLGVL